MIEDIEELGAELQRDSFLDPGVLVNREVGTLKRGPTMIFRPALPKLPAAGICQAGVSPARQVLRLLRSAFNPQELIQAVTVRPPA